MSTVAVDFDGVIHAYSRGWQDGSIYDEPIPGALLGIKMLQDKYAVYVFTSRDPEQVAAWLNARGVNALAEIGNTAPLVNFWERQDLVLVTRRKLPAVVYLDDRALRFTGWHTALEDVDAAASGSPAMSLQSLPDGRQVLADDTKTIKMRQFEQPELGELLCAQREANRLSLRELGERIGVPFNTLSRVERGEMCDLGNYLRICSWLDLHMPPQPAPIPNDSQPIALRVISDMRARMQHGIQTYGVALQAHNGRQQLWDLYEELLDATVYIRAAIQEHDDTAANGVLLTHAQADALRALLGLVHTDDLAAQWFAQLPDELTRDLQYASVDDDVAHEVARDEVGMRGV